MSNYRVGNYRIVQPPKGLLLKKITFVRCDVLESNVFLFSKCEIKKKINACLKLTGKYFGKLYIRNISY